MSPPRRRKPTEIKVGHAYRLSIFGKRCDDIILVTEIAAATKTSRVVRYELLKGHSICSTMNYSEAMRRIWCEEPRAVQ